MIEPKTHRMQNQELINKIMSNQAVSTQQRKQQKEDTNFRMEENICQSSMWQRIDVSNISVIFQ